MFYFCVMVENLSISKGGVEIRLKEQVQKAQSKSMSILKSIYERDKKKSANWLKKEKKRNGDLT